MLSELSIRNVAVIDSLDMTFSAGMTAMTGETGAGKSIIIDSINMLLGEKTNKALVRHGAHYAAVEGVFYCRDDVCHRLLDLGIETEDSQLILSRRVTADGRSVCRINGAAAPLSAVREISTLLVNIHGQHDNQALLNPSKHIQFLDNFAKNKVYIDEYKGLYTHMCNLKRDIAQLKDGEQEKLQRIDLLEYQINEITAADLKAGEDAELSERRNKIANSQKIAEGLGEAYELLYGGSTVSPAYDNLSMAVRALDEIKDFDKTIAEAYDQLSEALYMVEDSSHSVKSALDNVDTDEDELNSIEERLDLIHRLERKYGNGIESVLKFGENAQAELDKINMGGELLEKYENELNDVIEKITASANKLSQSRINAGITLGNEIEQSLHELNMEKAKFSVMIKQRDGFAPDGRDDVEFIFSANVGEPMKPLANIASGGELSRVMLAIKSVLSDTDLTDTLIFDEIDTGVSGSAAQKIAKKLKQTSTGKQVICITHQPQLAAAADHHVLIIKSSDNIHTSTSVCELNSDERQLELARIIDGENPTEKALAHAEELLQKSKEL